MFSTMVFEGGFSGEKDPNSECIQRKIKLLSEEGVKFEQESKKIKSEYVVSLVM